MFLRSSPTDCSKVSEEADLKFDVYEAQVYIYSKYLINKHSVTGTKLCSHLQILKKLLKKTEPRIFEAEIPKSDCRMEH